MATITKTFTENGTGMKPATWTVTLTGTDQIVSEDFLINIPTITAKYVYSGKNYANAIVGFLFSIGGYAWRAVTNAGDTIYWTSGGTKTLGQSSNAPRITLANLFNSTNKTSKTVDVSLTSRADSDDIFLVSFNNNDDYSYNYYSIPSGTYSWGKISTITLNAPPTATLGTPTYATPHYAGLGVYTVPITSAEAYYGGDISKVTLTIGQDSTEQTYSAATISNKTISVIPTIAGTYTPTITIEDSRGQTYTETLSQITVNPYLAPSLDFDVFRSGNSGIKDDEGEYGLITANVSFTDAIADLTTPTVKINGVTTSDVTWYSTYSTSVGVLTPISSWSSVSSGDTIYGLVDGSFEQEDSYVVSVTLTDSLGGSSAEITQTLSTAFYTIDFQAGGKEIAFGAPANDNLTSHPNGLFKCEMDVVFNGDVVTNGTVTANSDLTVSGDTTLSTGDTEIENPYFSLDTTAQAGTTDGDLYAAIVDLGWDSDVIV